MTVRNSLFIDMRLVNESGKSAVMFSHANVKTDIVNCTFTGTGGSMSNGAVGNVNLKNTLFYGHKNDYKYDFDLTKATAVNCFYQKLSGTPSATFFTEGGNRLIVEEVTDETKQVPSSKIKINASTDPLPCAHSARSILRGAGRFEETMLEWKDFAGKPRVSKKSDEVYSIDIGAYQYHPIRGLTVLLR
jgi:hypothetical protein